MTSFVAVVGHGAPPLGPVLRAAGASVVLTWADLTTCGEADDVPTVFFEAPAQAGEPAAVLALLAGLDVLAGGDDAVVATTRPVVDTLKLVDEAGVLIGTAERAEHRFVGAPIAARLGAFRAVAGDLQRLDGPALLAALAARGVIVVSCDR